MEAAFGFLSRFRRRFSFFLTLAISAVTLPAAGLLAVEFDVGSLPLPELGLALLVLLALRAGSDLVFRLSFQRWRYFDADDLPRTVMAVAAASAAFWIFLRTSGLAGTVPQSVVILEFVMASWGIAGIRVAYRLSYEWSKNGANGSEPRRVMIVGAGEAGNLVSREMERLPEYNYDVVGFLDDDPSKLNSRIRGTPVLGDTGSIPSLVERHGIDRIVIAIPSAGAEVVRRIVDLCEETEADVSILPAVDEVRAGRVRLSQLRGVTVEDLLAREPVKLELPELYEELAGRTVLITGAAGSIGSELARQVARHGPKRLLLLDQAESPLYLLYRELRDRCQDVRLDPIVADIVNEDRLREIVSTHLPSRVYHAAAYKHVPLMERNETEAIRNNVVGTWHVARAAGEFGVEKFVLVSTDKAVAPANIMGATKRVAELITLGCVQRFPETDYYAVRFGNVLGSQGSVLPIFKEQLAQGKPLTVTHPEVRRYFMTIPEAVQLVLQASVLPEGAGRISMLEMGEPVPILQLAKTLLRLSGVKNREDRIKITGLRPGEKLNERLVGHGERCTPTRIPKVNVVEHSADAAPLRVLQLVPMWKHDLGNGGANKVGQQLWATCRASHVSPRLAINKNLTRVS